MSATLDTAHQKLSDLMSPDNPDAGPVNSCFIDRKRSVLCVGVDAGQDLDQIKTRLEKLLGVEVEVGHASLERHDCATKNCECKPIWGGIQMESQNGFAGTICLVAKDQAEKLGFLVSSHVVGAGTTQVFGQPSTAKRLAGRVTVNPLLNGRESDSAFAAPYTTRTDVQEKPIWAAENVAYSVTAFETSDNTPPDTPVAMQGAAQAGLSTGSIQYTQG